MDFLTFEHVDGLLDSIEFIFGYHVISCVEISYVRFEHDKHEKVLARMFEQLS